MLLLKYQIFYACVKMSEDQNLFFAKDEILKQSHKNRSRMQERDPAARRQELSRMQAIAADPAASREFLLTSSMLSGLHKSRAITE